MQTTRSHTTQPSKSCSKLKCHLKSCAAHAAAPGSKTANGADTTEVSRTDRSSIHRATAALRWSVAIHWGVVVAAVDKVARAAAGRNPAVFLRSLPAKVVHVVVVQLHLNDRESRPMTSVRQQNISPRTCRTTEPKHWCRVEKYVVDGDELEVLRCTLLGANEKKKTRY